MAEPRTPESALTQKKQAERPFGYSLARPSGFPHDLVLIKAIPVVLGFEMTAGQRAQFENALANAYPPYEFVYAKGRQAFLVLPEALAPGASPRSTALKEVLQTAKAANDDLDNVIRSQRGDGVWEDTEYDLPLVAIDWDSLERISEENYDALPALAAEARKDAAARRAEGTIEAQLQRLGKSDEERAKAIEIILRNIAATATHLAELNERLDYEVLLARRANIAWRRIAEAARMSESAAWRRWDETARQRHLQYQRQHRKRREGSD